MKIARYLRNVLTAASILVAGIGNAEDNLAVIERNLAEQYSSIRSVEVQFRVIAMAPAEGPLSQENLDRAVRWEWLIDGAKKLIRSDPQRIADGQSYLEWYSFDGVKAYEASCYQADGSKLETIRIRSAINRSYFHRAVPSAMLGLHVGNCDSNTLDWLSRRTAETVQDLGIERIRDRDCRKVQFDNVPVGGKFLTRAIVWFDSTVDWLPCKLQWGPRRLAERPPEVASSKQPMVLTLAPGETIGRIEVTEYFRVEDPLLGRERWFPKRAQVAMGNVATVFQIDKVVLNQSIEGTRFIPTPVPGTQVDDQTSGQPTLVLHGGEEGLVQRQNMLRSAELIHLKNTGNPGLKPEKGLTPPVSLAPDARPRKWAWWWPVLGSLVVLSAAVSFRKWQRSRP